MEEREREGGGGGMWGRENGVVSSPDYMGKQFGESEGERVGKGGDVGRGEGTWGEGRGEGCREEGGGGERRGGEWDSLIPRLYGKTVWRE